MFGASLSQFHVHSRFFIILADILRDQVKAKSTNISFTNSLSVLFPRDKGILKEKLKGRYCLICKIIVMKIESIGVECAFINENQIALDLLKFAFFPTNLQELIHGVHIILSNIGIYNFNLS